MAYGIIRNNKYKYFDLNRLGRHIERKKANGNYMNPDIDKRKTYKNYSLKSCNIPYANCYKQIKEKYNLQGQIKKVSVIACEYVVTASPDFFEEIGEDETKRYFKEAYNFCRDYKDLGEDFIISAKVHMDETNPHMHLMYLPVVHKVDKKSGKVIHKLCCNDFWKMGQYIKLIKDFNNYMQEKGFDVERRITGPENEEIRLRYYKMVTGFELYKYNKMRLKKEEVKDTDDINFLKEEYKRLVKKCNIFADEYINIKAIVDSNAENFEKISKENETIKKENRRLNRIIDYLKKHIRKSYECVSLLFDIPAASIKSIVRRFVDSEERDNNSHQKEV